MIMNSWKSIGASEWAPPLMTLAMGTGRTLALGPPRYLKSGRPSASAAALALARETARMALAPELGLGLGAVQIEHDAVNGQLVERVHAFEGGQDVIGDILDGLGDALAEEAFLVAVAQFDGFVFAGAGAGGHRRAPDGAAGEQDVNFHGGIAARIEDFPRNDVRDSAHKMMLNTQSSDIKNVGRIIGARGEGVKARKARFAPLPNRAWAVRLCVI